MRDKPFRTPRTPKAPRLDWPGGIVPEWAKVPAGAARRGGKGVRGGKDNGKRERLQKVMAQSGHGSRRNIEILIFHEQHPNRTAAGHSGFPPT